MMQCCSNTSSFHETTCFGLILLDPGPSKASGPLKFYTWSCILSGLSSAILCPYVLVHLTGKLLSGIPSCISSGTLSANLCGISSGIRSGISSDILSGTSSGNRSDILSGILSGIPFGILSRISSNILSGIASGILSGISHGILSGISSGILSSISSNTLSGISSGILSGRWGPAAHTELGSSQIEVQRCTLSWEGPRLRSSGAHWAGKVPGWGPAVHTELGRSQVEVQRCTLSWEVGEESWQRAWRRVGRGGSWCRHGWGETGGGGGGGRGEEEEEEKS